MKTDVQLHAALGKAVQLWMDYHGYDESKKLYQLGDYEIRETYEELEEAQELDQSGLTAAMLLRSYVDWQARNNQYTVKDLLERREEVEEDVTRLQAMIDILESPVVKKSVESFIAWLRAGCEHYGMEGVELEALLSDPIAMAFVRRDAIIASGKLSVHWFTRGEPAPEAPQYAKHVYQWWNVNSLLAGLGRIGDAITLNLIRDAIGEYSYFAFACRQGGNLLVLTDKTDHAHPLQKGMARNPGREMSRRAFQYRFPYHLLDFVADHKGDLHVPDQKGLVPYNAEAITLGKLTDLTADEMAWIVMMLQLIHEQHLANPPKKVLLSYTGEMIVEPNLLEEQVRNLPIKWEGTQLSLPDTRMEDLTYENLEKITEREQTRWSEWMLDRYEDDVDPDLLDMVGDAPILRLPGERKFNQSRDIQLMGIDPVEFGTKEALHSDRVWLARYNQAKQIQVAAQEEYIRRKDEINQWFKRAIRKNATNLIASVVTGQLMGQVYTQKDTFDFSATKMGNLLRVTVFDKAYPAYHWNAPYGDWCAYLGEVGHARGGYFYHCHLSGERATVFGKVRPTNAEALATVCGCTVKKLPDVLQHYETNLPYTGNSLLSRIDPVEWAITNPWADLNFGVVIALSKNSVHRVRKKMGLPRLQPDDWRKLTWNENDWD